MARLRQGWTQNYSSLKLIFRETSYYKKMRKQKILYSHHVTHYLSNQLLLHWLFKQTNECQATINTCDIFSEQSLCFSYTVFQELIYLLWKHGYLWNKGLNCILQVDPLNFIPELWSHFSLVLHTHPWTVVLFLLTIFLKNPSPFLFVGCFSKPFYTKTLNYC